MREGTGIFGEVQCRSGRPARRNSNCCTGEAAALWEIPPVETCGARPYRAGTGGFSSGNRRSHSAFTPSMSYIELHACSAFSFLRGASKPEQLAERAVELSL